MRSSVRLHQAMLTAALVVPAMLFAAAGYANRLDVQREGRDAMARAAAIMQAQAMAVFETAALAIGRVDDRVQNENWDEIGSAATGAFLRRLTAPVDQIASIWVADREGRVRAGSGVVEPDFFRSLRAGTPGIGISQPFADIADNRPTFTVSMRRTTADDRFDGTIHASVSPAYFTRFFAEAASPLKHVAVLLRQDGTVLAADPADAAVGIAAPLTRLLAEGSADGAYQDGAGLEVAYAGRQVGSYPVWVAVTVPMAALLAPWYGNLVLYGMVASAAALTLCGVSFLALRRARAEQAALARLEAESRQRQAAELQLRHAQRMEAVGQLTGGLAHDFNNLLTAILGNLELIQRLAAKAPTTEGLARIDRLAALATKAVQRGAGLTKSLLAFSRKQPLQPRALDANGLVTEFLDLLRQAAGGSVVITFVPAAGLPLCVADPTELEAALLNLTINARDAMAGQERIRIVTAEATLDAAMLAGNPEARPGRFVSIGFGDNGRGMTAEVAAKAFEPFFTTKPLGEGTGLGLSQVFGFVRQLGGHVTLQSGPGQGTLITLFLPVVPGPL